jgi:hypothetical protein
MQEIDRLIKKGFTDCRAEGGDACITVSLRRSGVKTVDEYSSIGAHGK